MDAPTAVVVAGALSLIAAALSAWITSRVTGKSSRTNAMLEWAKQLQASEQAARKEAQESRERAERIRVETEQDVAQLRVDVDQLSAKLNDAKRLVDRLTDTLTSVQAEVWRPDPDIASLRKLVGRPSAGLNGR